MRRSCTVADAAAVAAEVRALVPGGRVGRGGGARDRRGRARGRRRRAGRVRAALRRRSEATRGGRCGVRRSRARMRPRGRLDPAVRAGARDGDRPTSRRSRRPGSTRSRSPCSSRASPCGCARCRCARAAVYAPGGRAPYPSTVVMGAVTARAAGVDEVVVAAPAAPGRSSPPPRCAAPTRSTRWAARRRSPRSPTGRRRSRASTSSSGPGNLYVQEAKRQVWRERRHRRLRRAQRPLVILSAGADPAWAARDLLAQAEHGPDSLVVAVERRRRTLLPDAEGDRRRVADGPRGARWRFAEAFAPEHLQLIGPAAEALAPRVRRAGCVFVGPQPAPRSATTSRARTTRCRPRAPRASPPGLNARHFRRRMAEVRIPRRPPRRSRPPAPRSRAPRASRPTPRRWRRDGRIRAP